MGLWVWGGVLGVARLAVTTLKWAPSCRQKVCHEAEASSHGPSLAVTALLLPSSEASLFLCSRCPHAHQLWPVFPEGQPCA